MNEPVVYLSLIFVLSYLFTWVMKRITLKSNILAIPNERSSHHVPTPTGGGIAIVIAWYSGITFMYFMNYLDSHLYFALLSGILLAVVGLIDDIFSIKPVIRLFIQFITAVLVFFFLGGINPVLLFKGVQIPALILYPAGIIGIVWFINLYNFLDGIDGYASIETICIASALFILTGNLINLLLIASVLGFLVWNWPRAKIFMGDAGSTQLGFILVVLGIYYHNERNISIVWWLILTAAFWYDASITLWRRMRYHEKLSQPHRKHIYQRLVQSGFSHLMVDILLILVNMILVFIVYYFSRFDYMVVPALLVSLVLLYSVTRYTDMRKPFLPD